MTKGARNAVERKSRSDAMIYLVGEMAAMYALPNALKAGGYEKSLTPVAAPTRYFKFGPESVLSQLHAS